MFPVPLKTWPYWITEMKTKDHHTVRYCFTLTFLDQLQKSKYTETYPSLSVIHRRKKCLDKPIIEEKKMEVSSKYLREVSSDLRSALCGYTTTQKTLNLWLAELELSCRLPLQMLWENTRIIFVILFLNFMAVFYSQDISFVLICPMSIFISNAC